MVYVVTARSKQPQGLQFDPDSTTPLHCTSTGKIYTSRLPPNHDTSWSPRFLSSGVPPNTITGLDEMMAQLEEMRRGGWAKTNEEFVKSIIGCAVPIVSPAGNLIDCLVCPCEWCASGFRTWTA